MSRYIQPHQSTQLAYQRALHPQAVHKQQCRPLMWNIIPQHPEPQPQPHPPTATGTHWCGTTSMSSSSLLRLQLYFWWQPLPRQEWSSVSAQPAEGKPFKLPTLKVGPASWQEGFVVITWFVWIKESTRCWHQHTGSCHNPMKRRFKWQHKQIWVEMFGLDLCQFFQFPNWETSLLLQCCRNERMILDVYFGISQ